MKKHTYDEIKQRIESISDCTLVSTEYTGTFDPLVLRCGCGKEFTTCWSKFNTQNKRQCNECGFYKAHRAHIVSEDEIRRRLTNKGLELLSEYKGEKKKIKIRCSCGHTKEMQAGNALNPSYSGLCDACAYPLYHGTNRLTTDDVREMCALRGAILLSEYKSAKEPLKLLCECGSEFETTWATIKASGKTRCNACTGRTSKPEKIIETWLKEKGFSFEREKSFPDCGGLKRLYRFDFYIPSKNACIEYDGQQHQKSVNFSGKFSEEEMLSRLMDCLDRDQIKTNYCLNKGIDLIRISYKDDIGQVLESKLIPR